VSRIIPIVEVFMAHTTSIDAYSVSPQSPTPFRIGSDEHKRAFCAVLIDLFDPYKPSVIAWPDLSQDAKRRLTELPFWDVAIETEGYASSRMQAMADTITDPLIRESIALNAFEEGRHKLVIRNMLRHYGIPMKSEQPYSAPQDPEWMFIRTGYGECLDSFFAFGLFKLAKDSGFFPPELVEVFEPVIHEEARHIMFFVNWAAWVAANKSLPGRIWFRIRCFMGLLKSATVRLSLAGTEVATGDLTPRHLLEVALAEDARRMERFDPRLLRPHIMPFFIKIILKVLPK
jgi:hypothetical protein